MKSLRLRSRVVCWVLIVAAGLLGLPTAMTAPRPAATGAGTFSVSRKSVGTRTSMQSKSVYAGDVVLTGASGATLQFGDGSRVAMAPNSSVELTETSGKTAFRALKGRMVARLRPGRSIETRTALVRVRGTEVHLAVAEDGTTELAVLEGEADLSNDKGAVTLQTGQQSVASPGVAPTAPVTIQNPGLLLEWTLQIERVVLPRETRFTNLSGAALKTDIARRTSAAQAQPQDAASQIALGEALFDARQFDAALEAFNKANDAVRSGQTLLELGRLGEAETAFQAAVGNAPEAALSGLAELELARDRAPEAQKFAERALAAAPDSARAQIALGIALMRQPGGLERAAASLQKAATAQPESLRYQAQAWLALVYLAQGDNTAAQKAARAAVSAAPDSGLARGNLSLVAFFSGNAREAQREARRAVSLNPQSVAARVALGQALLANNDIDAAQTEAVTAVSLDPRLPQARYLLGIADAGRRDWSHAARELKEALRLAPDFLPAAAALARVYTQMGRKTEAVAVLTEVQARQPNNKDVLTALGEVYYQQANYDQAITFFQQAVKQAPSALAYAGLAKVALDANRLDLAIAAGQKAVQLAPQIAQYHAILGQIYTFSRLDAQAERELRTALALDPQNAFALAQFSLKLVDGDARTTARTRGVGTRQAFLLDPAISDQLLRGGIDTELRASGGAKIWDGTLLHRNRALDGKLHFLGSVQRRKDGGNRPNSDQSLFDAYQELTYTVNPNTNVYLNLIHQEVKAGLPGFEAKPVFDDRDEFRLNQGIVGARHRLRKQTYLWAGFLDTVQRDDRINPGRDSSFRATPVFSIINVPHSLRRAEATSSEVRLDFPSNIQRDSSGIFSLGAARLRTRSKTTSLFSNAIGQRDLGILEQPLAIDTELAYLQLAQTLGKRLSLTGQLRYQTQKLSRDSIFTSLSPSLPVFNIAPERSDESDFLPSLVANYQLDRKTQLRLISNQRSTDVVSSIFVPVDSTNVSESQTLLLGIPRNLKALELDAERHLSSSTFLKAFLFRTTADSTSYSLATFSNPSSSNNVISSLVMSNVKRSGAGVRLEQRLTRNLFGQVLFAVNKTTGDTKGVTGTDQPLPYHPKKQMAIGLNYVDALGTKASLQINRIGSFFQDTGSGVVGPRVTFPAKTYVDFTLANEPSVRTEVFLKVLNLFNTRQIIFNDVSAGERRVVVGLNARF